LEKIGDIKTNYCRMVRTNDHNTDFQENKRHFLRRKLAKIAKLGDHNIGPGLDHRFPHAPAEFCS
jgi:hypothetical protein